MKKNRIKFTQQLPSKLIILLFIFLYFFIRISIIKNNQFSFFYDQARDAIISRRIIENGDLKVQGPSASGTNDTIYHGVFYYYFIAPLYTFSNGNPQIVMYAIILLNSLSIIPYYILLRELFKNESVAILSSFLLSISAEQALATTWLSNPNLANFFIILFYFLLWKTFFQKKHYLIPLAIVLAINVQIAFWLIFLLGSVFLSLYYLKFVEKKNFFSIFKLKEVLWAIFAFIIGISSMIYTQLKLYRIGIFTFGQLGEATLRSKSFDLQTLYTIFNLALDKLTRNYFPILPMLSFLVFIIAFVNLIKISKKQKWFLAIWLCAPFCVLAFHARRAVSFFMTYEVLAIIVLAILLVKIWQKRDLFHRTIVVSLLLLFIFSNKALINEYHQEKKSKHIYQEGVLLSDQLDLINYTYSVSNGSPFSISSYTNPLYYNTTWSYLYSWYGNQKYNYKPSFFGPSQEGVFGGDLLEQSINPNKNHFVILEPNVGAESLYQEQYLNKQNSLGNIIEQKSFGKINIIYIEVEKQIN